jgi:Flp pilus assembly pilin Flp
MVPFGILDCPVFLSWGLLVLLVANVSIMGVSCVVTSVAKTFDRS